MQIAALVALIACRGYEDATLAGNLAQHLVEKNVVAAQILTAALTERHHAGHVLRTGIVEDILKAEHVGGIGVFIEVLLAYQLIVVRTRSIAHGADVALESNAAMHRTGTAAGCRAQRVGSVIFNESVARMGIRKYLGFGGIVATYEKLIVERVDRQLVPETFDAIVLSCGIVEIGMGEVEPDVFHTDNHTFPRIGLRQLQPFIDRLHIDAHRSRVVLHSRRRACLDALDTRVERQGGKTVERNGGNVDVVFAGQLATTMLAQHAPTIAADAHKGTQLSVRHSRRPGCYALALADLTARQLLPGNLPHHRRHLAVVGPLSHGRRHTYYYKYKRYNLSHRCSTFRQK